MQSADNLIWIDLEMTGLDVDSCKIIEIAAIITDKDLNIIAEAEPIAIHQSDEILNSMNEWCIKVHCETGLTQRVKDSKISTEAAEQQILEFIRKFVPYQSSPLCGNSIWQDRRFLAKYMPKIDEYCHYRMLDVTTLKLLNQYWGDGKGFEKKNTHKALDDIRESIAELKFYRQKLLSI
ncbi:oligoribonuclease [Francisella tularensis subsp. novicida]|uniref:Oligoribonuclease n=2 Tax=Francisella tularensis TaxID=263 RepID=ORN_FRATN|nr:oligoribonuclease [Francisella tularensis]A0Q414.1 RecName: Full=Oligoribonuclease [Francisella tularensis subsp. novicida U112]ABK88979.1 oligoribonuclease (3'->5' exoribonuclease) [Francisella tularensis subsp. novicida U112]AJI60783.1 oligoribonuclease [Francisella tularensis subsp. novicida U112]APC94428.1 oligoribonuclease [Francisella tularensis subsp. novicida]EDX19372.1 exonuclease family protein [Francisella tularensis subsp. novicida FTE]EDZ90348.1 exonuclease family protein [Fra